MTISDLLTSFLRPCGAAHAPPKSPTPHSAPNVSRPNADPVDVSKSADKTNHTTPAGTQAAQITPGSDDKAPEKDKLCSDSLTGQNVDAGPAACETSDQVIKVYGFETLHQLHSKAWDDRTQALQYVRDTVTRCERGEHTPDEVFQASACVAQVALADKVQPVYLSALELARVLICEFAPRYTGLNKLVDKHSDAMLPMIVAKTSDRNARSLEATHRTLLSMAKVPHPGCRSIMSHVLTTVSTKNVTAICGRLELLELLIDEVGFSKHGGLSLSVVMSWVKPHLEAPDEKVRSAAVEVTVCCYSHKGERTSQYVAHLKPALLKLLQARFAEAGTKGKDRKKKDKKSKRALPALKGQQGQSMLTKRGMPLSRASSRGSTSSSGSGTRQSSSAGSAGDSDYIGSPSRKMMPLGAGTPLGSQAKLETRNTPHLLGTEGGTPTSRNMEPLAHISHNDPNSLFDKDDLDEDFMSEIEGFNL